MKTVYYCYTPLSPMGITEENGLVTGIFYAGGKPRPDLPEGSSAVQKEAARQLLGYFYGGLREFSLPLAMPENPFLRSVVEAMLDIPFGSTVTYSRLAEMASRPSAVRAVASACGKNPFAIVVPCHRVIAKKGIGGYSSGIELKKALLGFESTSLGSVPDSGEAASL